MGDRFKSVVYIELLEFFEKHGVSLAECGVGYRGLPEPFARQFLSLLASRNIRPLGLDVWRHRATGYSMDSLAGWASVSAAPGSAHQEALEVLATAELQANDVVSFQF